MTLWGDIDGLSENLETIYSFFDNEAFWIGVTDEEVEGQWVNERGQDVTDKLTDLWSPPNPDNNGLSGPQNFIWAYGYEQFLSKGRKVLDDSQPNRKRTFACQKLSTK